MPWLRCVTLALVIAALGGICVAPRAVAAADGQTYRDPLEGMNRGIFWFNDKVDVYALEPAGKVWDAVMPDRVKRSLANFFGNLRFPIVAGNDLLQAKFQHAASDVGRFVVNTTVGVAGFFDPATGWGLEAHDEDFGQTLGYWGVPPGPFLMLPFWGPSNPRDTVGLAADSFSTVYPYFVGFYYTTGARTVDVINTRALFLKQVQEAKAASLDYYAAVRSAYIQHRKAQVNDRAAMTKEEAEDLYTIDVNDTE